MSAIEKCPVADPGEGPVPPPPLFSDQKEAPRAEKICLETVPSPTPLISTPPPLRSGSADDVRLIEI